MNNYNAWTVLEQSPAQRAEYPLIVSDHRAYSYDAFCSRCRRTATFLRSLGVSKGMHVGICLSTNNYYAEFFFALARIGAVMVPIKSPSSERELEYFIAQAGVTRIVIGLPIYLKYKPYFSAIENLVLHIVIDVDGANSAYNEILDEMEEDDDPCCQMTEFDTAFLLFTSGTSGIPKLIPVTCGDVFFELTRSETETRSPQAVASILCTPMSHISAWSQLLSSIHRGRETIMFTRFSTEKFLEMLQRYQPVSCFVTPRMLLQLLSDPEKLAAADWRSMERFYFGYDATPAALKIQAAKVIPGHVQLVEIYGLTEACFNVTRLNIRAELMQHGDAQRLASVGKSVWGTSITIRGDDGAELPPECEGDVYVTNVSRNRQIYTNDRGFLDKDGYLHLTGYRIFGSDYRSSEAYSSVHNVLPFLQHTAGPAIGPASSVSVSAAAAIMLADMQNCDTFEEALEKYYNTAGNMVSATYYGVQYTRPRYLQNIFSDEDFEPRGKWARAFSGETKLYISARPTRGAPIRSASWSEFDSLDTFVSTNLPEHIASTPVLVESSSFSCTLFFFRYGDTDFTVEEKTVMQLLSTCFGMAITRLNARRPLLDERKFQNEVLEKLKVSFLATDPAGNVVYENRRSRRGRELLDEGEISKYLEGFRKNAAFLIESQQNESVSSHRLHWDAALVTNTYRSFWSSNRENIITIVKNESVREGSNPLADLLTPKEREVADLLSDGVNIKELAKALFISENTAKVHVQRIYRKLDVKNRAELMALLHSVKKQEEKKS